MIDEHEINQQIEDDEREDAMWADPEADYDEDFDEEPLDDHCPNCGTEYDEIDEEYQICHHCGFNNNKTESK